MNCRVASRLLPLHAGGDLGPGRSADLELHLAGCQSCCRELAAFAEVRSLLAAARAPLPAGDLWDALAPRLDAVDAARRLRRPWYRSPWPYSAAAAILLLLFLPPWVPNVSARGGVADSPRSSDQAVAADAAGLPSAAATVIATPGAADVLQQVPLDELDRFLRGHAGFRQPQSPDGGLLVTPASRGRGEF